jgi:hypothetical protein
MLPMIAPSTAPPPVPMSAPLPVFVLQLSTKAKHIPSVANLIFFIIDIL